MHSQHDRNHSHIHVKPPIKDEGSNLHPKNQMSLIQEHWLE